MHASLHRVTKITLREIKPLRKNGGEEGPIMSYVRYIQIEYEDDATLDVVCHSDDLYGLHITGYNRIDASAKRTTR